MKRLLAIAALCTVFGLVLGACGSEAPTPSPIASRPSPTSPPPTPTAAPAQPTLTPLPSATSIPPTPTAVPRPAATATPAQPAPKYGGTLQTRAYAVYPTWDTLDVAGSTAFHMISPLLNNLIFIDPYGDGKTLAGDAAERWEFSEGGKVLTFFLRRGINWHDGTPFTSRDVAYNLDRGWKPRSATMTAVKPKFEVIQAIETPDSSTVKITLSNPSNAFLQSLALTQFLMYPAHIPFPDRAKEWKERPIGTGPFKFKDNTQDLTIKYVRNDAYWKPGLPYLDGNTLNQMTTDACVPAFRSGKIDVIMFDTACTDPNVKEVQQAFGLIYAPMVTSINGAAFNQRAPWTDPRVREAFDLVFDRPAMDRVLNQDRVLPTAALPLRCSRLSRAAIGGYRPRS